ncbi:hypothetical protein COV06_01515 [Candidatus Uhrbacteria bacterium CG10_big_fil_rev_8_21_14_0_10_50_16]|uniref:Uncharacterized protein n=1 Tax=Candidatus Uhrbacteria bacterium CG10_big_fil_rev_8_21_14_0_10_50_16 TaxID=1975039 RepID=A0A2H0RNN1_9BACT|nr:MAG: hypothetical protein COV06_01515 [Candidatus Uhrbacteria bacterium CG10_big_fil_rev_8_21_14_0_10_50_16]
MTNCALFGERYGEHQIDDLLRLHERIVEHAHMMGKLLDFAKSLNLSFTFYVIPASASHQYICVVNVLSYTIRMVLNNHNGRCTLSFGELEEVPGSIFEIDWFGICHTSSMDNGVQQIIGESGSPMEDVLESPAGRAHATSRGSLPAASAGQSRLRPQRSPYTLRALLGVHFFKLIHTDPPLTGLRVLCCQETIDKINKST